MRILGISDHLTSGAALIEDGRVLAAVNEERLARKKMVMGFPRLSIASVLAISGTEPGQVDRVAVASHWGHFMNDLVSFDQGVLGVDEGFLKGLFFDVGERLAPLRSRLPFLERLYYDLRKPAYAQRKQSIERVLREELGITAPVEYVWHHHAHAASAYYASGYDDALVVTLDGSGDGHSSHVYDVQGGSWSYLHSVPSFDGLGNYYGYVTHLCGFKMGKHEGKITGLAAYGEDAYRDILERFIRYENGTMVNVGNAFRRQAIARLERALPSNWKKEDLAATIQLVAEDISTRYVAHWAKKTGRRKVALAGGVVANVKINQRIHELPEVDEVLVYPAMSDEGLGAGAALLVDAQLRSPAERKASRAFDHVYLGPDFSEREMQEALDAKGLAYTRPTAYASEVARLIADGYVVARCAGRMEYGPRALGNRSILYRPDDASANDWLNERLQRTEFMPFAPSTLAEDASRSFEGMAGAVDTSRFMTVTFDCSDEMAKGCPGVTHVDGTARPQTVSREDNAEYHAIISEFKRLTGLSSVVNTSFNIHEEPIVCSPSDAIRAFEIGHLDVLALGPFIVKHPEADARVRASRTEAGAKKPS
jgi:carbamoyltransferase